MRSYLPNCNLVNSGRIFLRFILYFLFLCLLFLQRSYWVYHLSWHLFSLWNNLMGVLVSICFLCIFLRCLCRGYYCVLPAPLSYSVYFEGILQSSFCHFVFTLIFLQGWGALQAVWGPLAPSSVAEGAKPNILNLVYKTVEILYFGIIRLCYVWR